LPFGLFPIHPCWFCFVLILTSGVGTCPVNELERIIAQYKQFCGRLEPRGDQISFPVLRRGAPVFWIPTVCQTLDEEHNLHVQ
jgi:hypothetical protein